MLPILLAAAAQTAETVSEEQMIDAAINTGIPYILLLIAVMILMKFFTRRRK